MSTTYTNVGPIYLTQAKYDALVTAGTVESGREYVIVDATQPVTDVRVNGTTVTSSGVANIPVASSSTLGVVKAAVNNGTYIESGSGIMTINKSDDAKLVAKTNNYCPVVPSNLNKAVMEGLGNNSLTWTDAYKSSARNTIGAIALEEYDSTATPADNILYYVTE